MQDHILITKNLSKSYKHNPVLKSIDLEIDRGQVYGLIGKNGAGKTTLIRIITRLMNPSGGIVQLNSNTNYIGYMPQSCRFDDNSTVQDTIKFFARLKKVNYNDGLNISNKIDLNVSQKVRYLSPGQQKKLQIIIAMIGNPDFYILDEPTAGLDPSATHEMLNIIQSIHSKGKTILISSHILQDMDNICTDIGILKNGKLSHNHSFGKVFEIQTGGITEKIRDELSKKYDFEYFNNIISLKNITHEIVPSVITNLVSYGVDIYGASSKKLETLALEEMEGDV